LCGLHYLRFHGLNEAQQSGSVLCEMDVGTAEETGFYVARLGAAID
jgi:hypothetical protein